MIARDAWAKIRSSGAARLRTRHWVFENDLEPMLPILTTLEARLSRAAGIDEAACMAIVVALREALANAVLHGNLELPSALEESDPAARDALAEERRQSSPYRERRVWMTVIESEDGITCVVSDEGPGFDPSTLPDPTELENLERTSGRGIFMIRALMDDVVHEDGGRTIRMVKRRTS